MVIGAGLLVAALVSSGDVDGSTPEATLSAEPSGTGDPSAEPAEPSGTGDPGAGTTAPTTPEVGLGEGVASERGGRAPLRGFGEAVVTVTGPTGEVCEVCMLAASTDDQQARGLMEVTNADLGGYDGMLFDYPEPVDGSFYMRNTPMPLSIAYFDADGAFVSATDMEPCGDREGCPTYPADRPFQYAIEVPRGALDAISALPRSTISVGARTCPLAD